MISLLLFYLHLSNSFLVSTLRNILSHIRLYLCDVKCYSDFPSIIFFCFYFILPVYFFYLFPSFLPSLPAPFFPSFLFEFWKCWGQGLNFCRSQQICCFCSRSKFPQTYGMCNMTGNSFPVAHQNPVLFLSNNAPHLFFTACSRHESHSTKFLYICEILFPALHKISSSICIFLIFCALVYRP